MKGGYAYEEEKIYSAADYRECIRSSLLSVLLSVMQISFPDRKDIHALFRRVYSPAGHAGR